MVCAQQEAKPLFWAWAITEPGAGTDMEDGRAMATMKPSSWASRVEGGYLLNGTKCFITNGSLAHYVIATLPADRLRPLESMAIFLVTTVSPGFRVGRVERKCGLPLTAANSGLIKTVCTDAALAVVTDAIQIHGGYGYMHEYGMERRMRDAKGLQLLGGSGPWLEIEAIAQTLGSG